jgi:hypothetical protein
VRLHFLHFLHFLQVNGRTSVADWCGFATLEKWRGWRNGEYDCLGDRLLHELDPLDRPQRDDRISGVLDRDRPVPLGNTSPTPAISR